MRLDCLKALALSIALSMALLASGPLAAGQISLTVTPDSRAEMRQLTDAARRIAPVLPQGTALAGAALAGAALDRLARTRAQSKHAGLSPSGSGAQGQAVIVQRGTGHQARLTQSEPGQRQVLIQTGQGAVADLAAPVGHGRSLTFQHSRAPRP